MFTATAILPDMVLTTITSNCQLKMSDDLRLSLPASWAFVDRYGQQVLDLVAKFDTDDRGCREVKKVVDQTARKQENEGKAVSTVLMGNQICTHSSLPSWTKLPRKISIFWVPGASALKTYYPRSITSLLCLKTCKFDALIMCNHIQLNFVACHSLRNA